MAKGTWKQDSKDNSIFSGKVTVSSHSPRKCKDTKDKLRGVKLVKSRIASDEKLKELGLLDRDELVVSFPPRKPTSRK